MKQITKKHAPSQTKAKQKQFDKYLDKILDKYYF